VVICVSDMSTVSMHSPGCLSCAMGLCPPASKFRQLVIQTFETGSVTHGVVFEPAGVAEASKAIFSTQPTPEDEVHLAEVERDPVLVEAVLAKADEPRSLGADDVMSFSFTYSEMAQEQANEGTPECDGTLEEEPLLPRVETASISPFERFMDVLCGFFVCFGDAASAATDGMVLAGHATVFALPLIESSLQYKQPYSVPTNIYPQERESVWAGENQNEVFNQMVGGLLSGKSHVPRSVDSLPLYGVLEPGKNPLYDKRYEVLRGHLPEVWTEMPAVERGPPGTRWIWNPIYRWLGTEYTPAGVTWAGGVSPNAYELAIGHDQRHRDETARYRNNH